MNPAHWSDGLLHQDAATNQEHPSGYDGAERRAVVMTPHVIEVAVAAGIRTAVSDPELWAAAGKAMREQAQTAAGGLVLSGIRAAANRAAWILLLVLAIYSVGGWQAVVSWLKAQSPK